MRKLQLVLVRALLLLLLSLSSSLPPCDATAPSSLSSSSRAALPQQRRQGRTVGNQDKIIDNTGVMMKSADDIDGRFGLIRGGHFLLLSSTLLSKLFTITGQTLNVATLAIVGSGYVGCYIASLAIVRLQQYCCDESSSSTIHQWKWTFLASIGHCVVTTAKYHPSNNYFLRHLFNNETAPFILILGAYSYLVNTKLGGFIGCLHVIFDGISTLLGSHFITNRLSSLMNIRLPPLDHGGGNNIMSYEDATSTSFQNNKLLLFRKDESRNVLVRVFSSLSIFTSFPRNCLSLYLIATTLFTFWASSSSSSVGGEQQQQQHWTSWWLNGLFGNVNTIIIGAENSPICDHNIMANTMTISTRLFALHWIIILVKGMTAILFG